MESENDIISSRVKRSLMVCNLVHIGFCQAGWPLPKIKPLLARSEEENTRCVSFQGIILFSPFIFLGDIYSLHLCVYFGSFVIPDEYTNAKRFNYDVFYWKRILCSLYRKVQYFRQHVSHRNDKIMIKNH